MLRLTYPKKNCLSVQNKNKIFHMISQVNPLWDSSTILLSGRLRGLATKLIHLAGLTDNIIKLEAFFFKNQPTILKYLI